MKRREFIYGSASIIGGEFLAQVDAAAQAPPAQPMRVSRLVVSSIAPDNTACQDVIFDGQQFICLYSNRNADISNREYFVAATTPSGSLLWNYSLPKGTHFSLGTHERMIITLAGGYAAASGIPVVNPIWLLDPKTGNASITGEGNTNIRLSYAGDSVFFGVAGGKGQIRSFDGGLKLTASGITAQSFAAKFPHQEFVPPDTMAVAPLNGHWLARVSIQSGAVQEDPISGEFVSNVRSFYESFFASVLDRQGIDPTKTRVARPSVILAVGGDQDGGVYSLVATPKRGSIGLMSLVRFDQSGVGTLLGELQLPTGIFGWKVVILNSEVCVLSGNGSALWYSLPKPA
jgi:hypothetical protein